MMWEAEKKNLEPAVSFITFVYLNIFLCPSTNWFIVSALQTKQKYTSYNYVWLSYLIKNTLTWWAEKQTQLEIYCDIKLKRIN